MILYVFLVVAYVLLFILLVVAIRSYDRLNKRIDAIEEKYKR